MPINSTTASKLRSTIDAATANPSTGIPGFVAHVVNKDGQELFSYASGRRAMDKSDPMTMETIFHIASCTKMIGGIACMQLVEQGKLSLDDADLAEKICPELKTVMVLQDDGTLAEKKNRITLRMLLSHTAGFGYTFFSDRLRRWALPVGVDELDGTADLFTTPLLFEPGTDWAYGVNVDWAGLMVERVSGLSLEDYFQKNIFRPLGIKEITLFPSTDMKERLAYMHQRDPAGIISLREHLYRKPLRAEDRAGIFNSAGAGCFAKPTEYCKLLVALMNNGTSPETGATILKPATVENMFTNQIPQMPNFGRVLMPDTRPDITNVVPELYPQPHDQPQGWGLSFMQTIHPGATGRGGNTVWWAGIANLYYWCDRENGVAGMVATQILPFADAQVLELWTAVEAGVYSGLNQSKL